MLLLKKWDWVSSATYPVNNLNMVIISGVASTPNSSTRAVLTISSSVDFILAAASFGKSDHFFGNIPDWSTNELFCPMMSFNVSYLS